uniref:Cathepsin B-like cysteine proteinase n=1 Tax=Schistosoma haematobium TaxID=6185 RepID=A0A095A441_SCHHA
MTAHTSMLSITSVNICPVTKIINETGHVELKRLSNIDHSFHAFGAVEAMSDRTCIQSRGRQSVELSAVDLMSCCSDCGFGCDGGFLGHAWDYWVKEGIVTGSSKENHTGCQPYPFPKCEHHAKGKYPACGKKIYKTPRCKQTCQKSYKIPYAQDKHRGKLSYNVADNELSIQKEIMKYGPVEAAFTVYEDFLNYKSGIYEHITGEPVGGHAIRIIGWGVEKNTPYWLIANSWNEDWGENGYFRILRGHDECGIESEVTAGRIN